MKKYKTEFMHDYKFALPKDDLEKIWKQSYQFARRIKKKNPQEFLMADGTFKKIANKALTYAKEYVWAIKNNTSSRVKLYYGYDKKLSAEERERQAIYNTYIDRLNYKNSSDQSFMEKYDNEEHLYQGKTISDVLEEYNIDGDKQKLNEWLASFKEFYSNEFKSKEFYETQYALERD